MANAATHAGTTIVCTGTIAISYPLDLVQVVNNATTSFTIVKGSNTLLSGSAGTGGIVEFPRRIVGGCTVTVVGGGSVTLVLRTQPTSC